MLMRSLMFVATCAVSTASVAGDGRSPLAQERGATRPLVVVVASATDPTLADLKTALKQAANRRGFAERGMVLFTVIDGRGQRDGRDLSADATRALLDGLALQSTPLPVVVLVGKDGGKKLERRGPIDLATLFGVIDAMPMRRDEVGRRAGR
jgi:hypothetical protein